MVRVRFHWRIAGFRAKAEIVAEFALDVDGNRTPIFGRNLAQRGRRSGDPPRKRLKKMQRSVKRRGDRTKHRAVVGFLQPPNHPI